MVLAMIKRSLLALAAVGLASVVYAQTTTNPPPGGSIGIVCTYQSNEANAAMTTGRYGFVQCDNRGYLKVTPTGSGGGGGAVTIASGGVASGAYSAGSFASSSIGAGAFSPNSIASGSAVDGWDLTQGNRADSVCATDTSTTCSVISMLKRIAQTLTTIATNVATSIPAGNAGIGKVAVSPTSAQFTSTPVSFSSAGNNIIILRTAGTIKLYQLVLACASSSNITVMNGTSVSASGIMPSTSMFLPLNGEPYYTTTSTNNLVLNQPSAVQCGGTAYYLEN